MTDVQQATLPNGLTILAKEVHSAPVATFWIWYRVGGRNEIPGLTGISHWVEHMLFKGTPNFGKGEIMHLVNKNGGVLNGFTWTDCTTYFESLPSDRLELALQIESDRMANAVFDSREVDSERTVIISEREGAENFPQFLLDEEVTAAAFKVHPYRHGVIGWKCDLQAITRDDLYNHYRTFYTPNNAVAVAVGDFDTAWLLEKVAHYFAPIPAGPTVPVVRSVEPPQPGERRVTVQQPGGASYLQAAFHVPDARHADFFPLFVLSGALAGVKSMNLFGRGSPGRSARLYRALVETGLATEVDCAFGMSKDPGLFTITATVRAGSSLPAVEAAALVELEKVAREPLSAETPSCPPFREVRHDGVSDTELAKVLKQVKAQFVYAGDGVINLAYWLGMLEMVTSHQDYDLFLDRLAAVTQDDVQRVAAHYLTSTNRTVGWFVPTAER
jgi:zinc protease